MLINKILCILNFINILYITKEIKMINNDINFFQQFAHYPQGLHSLECPTDYCSKDPFLEVAIGSFITAFTFPIIFSIVNNNKFDKFFEKCMTKSCDLTLVSIEKIIKISQFVLDKFKKSHLDVLSIDEKKHIINFLDNNKDINSLGCVNHEFYAILQLPEVQKKLTMQKNKTQHVGSCIII